MPKSKAGDGSYRILFDQEHEDGDIEGTASPATRVGSIESFGKSFHISQEPHMTQYIEARRSSTDSLLTWIRWLLILCLQLLIIVFLIRPVPVKGDNCVLSGKEGYVETGDDINGLYKTCTFCLFNELLSCRQLTSSMQCPTHIPTSNRKKTNTSQI